MGKKGFFKKTAAMAAAGTMLVSCTGTAWAGAFADTMKAELEKETTAIVEEWDESLNELDGSKVGNVDLTVNLADTGRSMITMLGGLDVSWLKRLGIKMDFALAEGKEQAILDLYANEQTLATMLMDIDLAGELVKAMIPELSSSAITAPMTFEADGFEDSEQFMRVYMDILRDPKAVLPDGNTVKELYDRYGSIIFDHMEDGESGEAVVSAGGIEENATVVEGILDTPGAIALSKDILATAKEDEQIAQIVKNLETAAPDLSGLYDKMQSGIDDVLKEIDEEGDPEEDVTVSSKTYTNADGKNIGAESTVFEDGAEVMTIICKYPSDGDQTGLEFSISADGETYGIEGTGTITDDIVNGEYQFMANGVAMASATVENLDVKAGNSGTITLKLIENMPDEDTYSAIGSIVITITLAGEGKNNGSVEIEVSYAGSSLGSIRLAAAKGEGTVDVSALDAAANVYDTENDEDMAAFAGEINPEAILDNLTAAGAPEGFAESLISLFEGGGDDYVDYDYDDDYDYDYDYDDAEETAATDAAA